jgi:hypothetical protein
MSCDDSHIPCIGAAPRSPEVGTGKPGSGIRREKALGARDDDSHCPSEARTSAILARRGRMGRGPEFNSVPYADMPEFCLTWYYVT